MIHLYCALPQCDWDQDPAADNLTQYRNLKQHFHDAHFGPNIRRKFMTEPLTRDGKIIGHDGIVAHPTPGSPSVRNEIWEHLVDHVAVAMNWPTPESGPFEDGTIAKLEDDVKKAQAVSAGRGIAIALEVMLRPKFASVDDVIREGVRLYQERAAQPTPEPTATEAQQVVQQELGAVEIPADPTVAPTAPAPPAPPVTAPAPPAAPVLAPPAPPAPPAPAAPAVPPVAPPAPVTAPATTPTPATPTTSPTDGLEESTVAAIKNALESGFGAEDLAGMFNLTVAQVEALR